MSRKRDSKGRFLPKGHGGGKKKGKRKYKHNPGNPGNPGVKHYAKKAYSHARGFLGGLGVGEALKAIAQGMVGAGAGFLVRKKFGGVSSQRDNWEMKDYFMAGAGALGASAIAKWVFRASPQTSRNIMVGGLMLIGIKLLQDEIVPNSETLQNWIGEENPEGTWEGIGAGGQPAGYLPGDVMLGEDNQPELMYGTDGMWRPIDESHRLSGMRSPGELGEDVETFSGLGSITTPTALGADDPYANAYRRAR